MPAIALSTRRGLFERGLLEPFDIGIPPAHGTEGQMLLQTELNVLQHWQSQAEFLLLAEKQHDVFSYQSIPLKSAFSVNVRYQYVGELKPLFYPLDE